jgi:nucleoside-diphosphate-sugar epimerase
MEGMPVSVVTGGAGFIGSHLCERLLEEKHVVYAIDNLVTGNEGNLAACKGNPSFTFIFSDVIKNIAVLPRVDYVYHLASPASVVDYQKYPEETALVNSVGTRNTLKFAAAYKAKYLFASTSEIYGDPKEHPQKETYWGNVNPHGIRACYDESKRFGEMLTMLYTREGRVDGRIVRIFNTYGPRMKKNDGRVISNFVTQAISGKPVTVYGDGTQTRSFCYVSDLVEGLILAMMRSKTRGEVVNLGNPVEFTISSIACVVKEKTKSASPIVFSEIPQDDPVRRKPDITKAKKLLGWKPTVGLEEGLDRTIAYYRNV